MLTFIDSLLLSDYKEETMNIPRLLLLCFVVALLCGCGQKNLPLRIWKWDPKKNFKKKSLLSKKKTGVTFTNAMKKRTPMAPKLILLSQDKRKMLSRKGISSIKMRKWPLFLPLLKRKSLNARKLSLNDSIIDSSSWNALITKLWKSTTNNLQAQLSGALKFNLMKNTSYWFFKPERIFNHLGKSGSKVKESRNLSLKKETWFWQKILLAIRTTSLLGQTIATNWLSTKMSNAISVLGST